MDEVTKRSRPINRAARVSLALAFLALLLGTVDRLGAGVGLLAVVFGIWGVLIGEKTEAGIPASLFGIAIGVVAVLWAAASFVSR